MNKYKVEFTHVFDVKAKTEEEAIKKADALQDEAILSGTLHYHLNNENVYDVTHTDDPFNP